MKMWKDKRSSVICFILWMILSVFIGSGAGFCVTGHEVIQVHPKPDYYAAGSFVAGRDGNFYLFGALNGTKGLLRITSTGAMTMLVPMNISNFLIADKKENVLRCLLTEGGGTPLVNVCSINLDNPSEINQSYMSPMPSSYLVCSFLCKKNGNVIVGGYLNGVKGFIEITPDGNTSTLVSEGNLGTYIPNNLASDIEGKYGFVLFDNTLSKFSMNDGVLQRQITLSPTLYASSVGNFEYGADENIYTVALLEPGGDPCVVSISSAGAVEVLDAYNNGAVVTSVDGTKLYVFETVDTSADAASHLSPGIRPGFNVSIENLSVATVPNLSSVQSSLNVAVDNDVQIRQYTLKAGQVNVNISELSEKVIIQGGAKGYVNPDKGENARIYVKPSGTGTIEVKIFDLNGRLVWEYSVQAGAVDYVDWPGLNLSGQAVASNVYIVRVEGAGINETKKVVIVR